MSDSSFYRGGSRHRLSLPRLLPAALVWLATALCAAPAAAQSTPPPTLYNAGLRWLGIAANCDTQGLNGWRRERLFRSTNLPAELTSLCLYTWNRATTPRPADVADLFQTSEARELTEDVPVLYPAALSSETQAWFMGLRRSLRAQVGDASLLPLGLPAVPRVRIAVIDTAPDATAGNITTGASRHGDTLAHMIEDLVCRPVSGGVRECAAEVTTSLAMPWLSRGVLGTHGGHLGSLSDVARAIERAVQRWQSDRASAPGATPPNLELNLSFAWEHTDRIADCTTGAPQTLAPPARAVRGILQSAAGLGVLIVAAAGNDSAGPTPRTGLACPGLYQAVPRVNDPRQSLVIAASGVDYSDRPLETTRPLGVTSITGLGLGGVAWSVLDPAPPQLTGSSVAAAVVSAVSALTWAFRPAASTAQIMQWVHDGGVSLNTQANACASSTLLTTCGATRASVCGALQAAGAGIICARPAPLAASCPALPAEIAAVTALYSAIPTDATSVIAPQMVARFLAPTVQVMPSVFPQPISDTCPTCLVNAIGVGSEPPYLLIPEVGKDLSGAALVVHDAANTKQAFALGDLAAGAAPYRFDLPLTVTVAAAYLTGLDSNGASVNEQIFVAQ